MVIGVTTSEREAKLKIDVTKIGHLDNVCTNTEGTDHEVQGISHLLGGGGRQGGNCSAYFYKRDSMIQAITGLLS